MVQKQPFTNHTNKTIYVGNVGVPPGSTREVDMSMAPSPTMSEDAPQDVTTLDDSPVAVLRQGSVKDITGALVDLPDADLAELKALEVADTRPRITLVAAIEQELLRRGSMADAVADMEARIAGMDLAALEVEARQVAERPELLQVVQDAIDAALAAEPAATGGDSGQS